MVDKRRRKGKWRKISSSRWTGQLAMTPSPLASAAADNPITAWPSTLTTPVTEIFSDEGYGVTHELWKKLEFN
jgi:hypothetical protein